MIIFKTEDALGAWDINGTKILCKNSVENWDYEIKGKWRRIGIIKNMHKNHICKSR